MQGEERAGEGHRNFEYANRASKVMDLREMTHELGETGGLAGVSALGYIAPSIKAWLDRAARDNDAAAKALSTSARGLTYSREYYQRLDEDRWEELDRLHHKWGFEPLTGKGKPSPSIFDRGPQPIRGQDVAG